MLDDEMLDLEFSGALRSPGVLQTLISYLAYEVSPHLSITPEKIPACLTQKCGFIQKQRCLSIPTSEYKFGKYTSRLQFA